jgi:hypothetical protein
MTGTNPGAWPDQEPNEPNMARKDSFILPKGHEYWNAREDVYISKARPFTAADLKAARLETVERCLHLLDLYISNVGPLAAKKAIEMFKEEINEG